METGERAALIRLKMSCILKPSNLKLTLLVSGAWALLPWILWLLYQFHKPDHADIVWWAATPAVFIAYSPMIMFRVDSEVGNWFPMAWVVGCSAFNFVIGTVICFFVRAVRNHRAA
jgi:hypothetical protein